MRQILAVRGYGDTPSATLTGPTGTETVALQGRLDWRLSERTCTGRWERGRHAPCPDRRAVGPEGVCTACTTLEDPACIFEPRCQADASDCTCLRTFREVPHVVYLAFYGGLPKVGLTMAVRLRWRLLEQGADMALVLASRDADGKPLGRGQARAIEREVTAWHHVPEYRKGRELLAQVTRPLDPDAMRMRLERWRARLRAPYPELGTQEPMRFDYPIDPPLPRLPAYARGDHHQGVWLGGKGRYLFYQGRSHGRLATGRPPVLAVKTGDLVGRWIDAPGGS